MDSFLPIDRRPRPRVEASAEVERLRAVAGDHGALVACFDAGQDLAEELSRPDWLEPA